MIVYSWYKEAGNYRDKITQTFDPLQHDILWCEGIGL